MICSSSSSQSASECGLVTQGQEYGTVRQVELSLHSI